MEKTAPSKEEATESKEKILIRFPEQVEGALPQDAEYCEVEIGAQWRRIRFHDYNEIYAIPGLYERLFYDKLDCHSPQLMRTLLEYQVQQEHDEMEDLVVFDVGAGNGMMGKELVEAQRFNCMTLIAALGFGEIPPEVFAYGFNMIEDGGWIAFNIKEDFLDRSADDSGFSELVRLMLDQGWFEPSLETRYVHRKSIQGEPLHYLAIVGHKRADIVLSN